MSSSDIAWVLAGADMQPAPRDIVTEDLPALFHVTDEMRSFAEKATRSSMSVAGKTMALAEAMGARNGLNARYDPTITLTAEQAFRQRRVNCLSYTLLFIAMAREIGLPARFNEVDIPPIWDMADDHTFLLYRHVNARVEAPQPFFQIVDINRDEYDPRFDQHVISDLAAEAEFYNNRSVELREQQRYADALRYQLRALELAPEMDYLWTNLAALYLLNDKLRAARIAVTKALALDASSRMSYDIAAQVYERLGNHQLATYFHERAQYFLDQNPYYHYQLALSALRRNDERLADTEVQRAISLDPKEPRFFFLAAVVLDRLGDTKVANDYVQTAIDLTPDTTQQEHYRSKFARLTSRS